MRSHTFIVTVAGCTAEQARTVMDERIRHDEEYGFTYGVDYEPTPKVTAPSWSVPVDAAGEPLLDDLTVRTMWEFATSAEDMQARINRAAAEHTTRSPLVTSPEGRTA